MTPQTLIKFIIGLGSILFIIWLRFIHKRDIISLSHISLNNLQISLRIAVILLFLFLVYINLKKLLKYEKKTIILEYKYVQKIVSIIKEYYSETPEFIYKKLTVQKDYDLIFERLADHVTYYNPKNIIIMLIFLPQIIISTTFLIDILYFASLNYFFVSLNLLIIVLTVRVLRFLFEILSARRAYLMEQYLNIEHAAGGFNFSYKKVIPTKQLFSLLSNKGNNFPKISLIPPELQRKNQIPLILTEQWLIPLAKSWHHYRWIYDYMIHFQQLYQSYSPYFMLYTSLCYLIGWISYLYLIL